MRNREESSSSASRGASVWCDLEESRKGLCVDTIQDRIWSEQVRALYMDPRRHAGRRVRLVGILQDESLFGTGWVHVGRLMVWCCAADASVVGFYVRTGGPVGYSAGAWVAVEGRVSVRSGRLSSAEASQPIPVLEDAVFQGAVAPAQPNVFPLAY